jgi:hypothetical protein
MHTLLFNEEKQVAGMQNMPAVSIILPFEAKMSLKNELQYALKLTLAEVERTLMREFSADLALPVLNKLQHAMQNLNYNTHKKSVAIFVSPGTEKVFYLDVQVERRIVVDDAFAIRDLVYSKKFNLQYLILFLSSRSSKMYLGNASDLTLIKSNARRDAGEFERDMPEIVSNFSDPLKHKEILLNKFIHQMDEGLSLILKAYPFPVFVLGVKRVLGHFKEISKNDKSIAEYIYGNYEGAGKQEILRAMSPHIKNWKLIKQRAILKDIERARGDERLATGMKDVWQAVSHKNGRLLIVEKDFLYPARKNDHPRAIYEEDPDSNDPFFVKDRVDEVMGKILENGGDVEFIDNGLLEHCEHIALIRFFNRDFG